MGRRRVSSSVLGGAARRQMKTLRRVLMFKVFECTRAGVALWHMSIDARSRARHGTDVPYERDKFLVKRSTREPQGTEEGRPGNDVRGAWGSKGSTKLQTVGTSNRRNFKPTELQTDGLIMSKMRSCQKVDHVKNLIMSNMIMPKN